MDRFDVRVAECSSPPAGRALRALAIVTGIAVATGCGKVSSNMPGDAPVSGGDASMPPVDGTPPAPLLAGCSTMAGDRPTSTSSADAPRVSHLTIDAAMPGKPLSGSLNFDGPQPATTLIVQVLGTTSHLACALASPENTAKQVDLSRLTVSAGASTGSFFAYFGVSDSQGNVSGYALGTVVLGAARPVPICGGAPLQVIGKAPSEDTASYTTMNGTTPDYLLGPAPGAPLSIVDRVQVYLDLGSCSHVALGSEPTAMAPVGWDNFLLVEYRTAPGQPVTRSWYYAPSTLTLINARASQPALVHGAEPTVVGTSLDPQVPSTGAFGYPPRAIDFMSDLPLGSTFELTLYVLDSGGSGSTTEIWLFPQ